MEFQSSSLLHLCGLNYSSLVPAQGFYWAMFDEVVVVVLCQEIVGIITLSFPRYFSVVFSYFGGGFWVDATVYFLVVGKLGSG